MENKKVILIVDDVDDLRTELASIVEDEGYSVLQAANGRQALTVLSERSIDLIITDIFMPEMDGIELAMLVRQSYPGMKLVIISGGGKNLTSGNEYEYLGASEVLAEPDEVLKKPFTVPDLLGTIHRLLT